MILCATCQSDVPDVRAYERHLVEDHLMGAKEAKDAASRTAHQSSVKAIETDHACPSCGALIPCDWRSISALEEQARRLRIIAGLWRAKLMGVPVGRPKTQIFDVDRARECLASGLSYRQTARVLNVHHEAIRRAVTDGKSPA